MATKTKATQAEAEKQESDKAQVDPKAEAQPAAKKKTVEEAIEALQGGDLSCVDDMEGDQLAMLRTAFKDVANEAKQKLDTDTQAAYQAIINAMARKGVQY